MKMSALIRSAKSLRNPNPALMAAGLSLLLTACQHGGPGPNSSVQAGFSKDAPQPACGLVPSHAGAPPANLGAKAVYVLPVTTTGFVAGQTDPHTGDYVGPHSVSSILEEGHWASQEEAELQGKPYLLPDTQQIIYPAAGSYGQLRPGKGVMDVNRSRRAYWGDQSSADQARADKSSRQASVRGQYNGDNGPIRAPVAQPLGTSDQFTVSVNSPQELVFYGGRAGEIHTVTLANRDSMRIAYLSDSEIELRSGDKTTLVTIKNPSDHVRVKLAKAQ